MSLVKILIFCIVLVFHLLHDYNRINKNKIINHYVITIPRLIIFLIISFWESHSFIQVLHWFINLNMFYWLFFDLMLNELRDKPLNYVGKSACSDRLLRYLHINNVYVFKTTLIFIINIIFLFI